MSILVHVYREEPSYVFQTEGIQYRVLFTKLLEEQEKQGDSKGTRRLATAISCYTLSVEGTKGKNIFTETVPELHLLEGTTGMQLML